MKIKNFFKKIISRFKESCNGITPNFDLNKEMKKLKPLKNDFLFPNIMDYNTEKYFKKGGFGYGYWRKEYLFLKKGVSLKKIEVSRFVHFERIKRKELNLCDICDSPDIGFLSYDADICTKLFNKEKLFCIVIGKIKNKPIFYMN